MELPQAQQTRTVTPTTRPWRARALVVIAAVLIPGLAATTPSSLTRPARAREQ
jgi:hypothetical protein